MNKGQKIWVAGALGLCLAGTGLVPLARAADSTPHDKSLVMTKIDTDNDGTVSLAEAKAAAEAKFGALDTDHEGTLDASELTGIAGKHEMAKADSDHDATLDKAEYLAMVSKKFQAADVDHDGTLDEKKVASEKGRALVPLLAY